MKLKKLKLVNFRNYTSFEQDFTHLKTIIIGQNAQGKSNILEAINILATTESERAERDSDLVYWNNDHALIFADIESKDYEPQIALQINSTGRRKLKINGVSKKAPQADLLGNFFAVMFSCDDLYLIKGSPSGRRRWIDSVLFQLNPRYHKLLQDYQKSVTQKNALLKKAQETRMNKKDLIEQIDIWNEQMINSGIEVTNIRIELIRDIILLAADFLINISKQSENLSLVYKSTVIAESKNQDSRSSSQDSAARIQDFLTRDLFKAALAKSFDQELARGQSIIGPHRDDLLFLINDRDAKSFASQGQQRSIVLSIKLAELKVFEKQKGEIPVLLLDDVFAELDESRQDYLLHNLPENIQIFLTTTHLSNIQKEFLKGAQVLTIEKGKIIQKEEAALIN